MAPLHGKIVTVNIKEKKLTHLADTVLAIGPSVGIFGGAAVVTLTVVSTDLVLTGSTILTRIRLTLVNLRFTILSCKFKYFWSFDRKTYT